MLGISDAYCWTMVALGCAGPAMLILLLGVWLG